MSARVAGEASPLPRRRIPDEDTARLMALLRAAGLFDGRDDTYPRAAGALVQEALDLRARAAKEEALLPVPEQVCEYCRNEDERVVPEVVQSSETGAWGHRFRAGTILMLCRATAVWDAIQALRGGKA
jgi:hypothetical protein